LNKSGGVWIFGETDEKGRTARSTRALISMAGRIAGAASKEFACVLIGSHIKEAAEECLRLGPARVYLCMHTAFAQYDGEVYAQGLESICKKYHPDILLAAHSPIGQDLLPRLAARLDTQIVTDCIELAIDERDGGLLMTKPIYGGNAVAVFTSDCSPQMATVRARIATPPQCHTAKEAELVPVEYVPVEEGRSIKRIQKMDSSADGARLEDAEVIVAGGRGIGSAEGFDSLRELAAVLGGAVGASRPPCDIGWMPSQLQIGLTGKVVAPKLYFAVAVSGMMQHIMGMFESGCVVAINKDKDAAIFRSADYGVVGDYREVLPSFIGKLQEMRTGPEQS